MIGKATRKPRRRTTRAGLVDPQASEKDAAEAEWQQALAQFLRRQRERILAEIERQAGIAHKSALQDAELLLSDDFWDDEDEELLAVILPLVTKGARAGSAALIAAMGELAIGVDWTQPSAMAVAWAREHAGKLIKGINETTREAVAESVASWLDTPGSTMGDLFTSLQEVYAFGEERAQMIGVTEVTQAYAEGSAATCREAEAGGLLGWQKTWHTNEDELVCPLCEALDNQTCEGIDGDEWTGVGFSVPRPPLHPNCRCWVTETPIVTED